MTRKAHIKFHKKDNSYCNALCIIFYLIPFPAVILGIYSFNSYFPSTTRFAKSKLRSFRKKYP